jgi:hypothetical protein
VGRHDKPKTTGMRSPALSTAALTIDCGGMLARCTRTRGPREVHGEEAMTWSPRDPASGPAPRWSRCPETERAMDRTTEVAAASAAGRMVPHGQ